MSEQHFKNIYTNNVAEYHDLVSREDHLGNLKQFLLQKIPENSKVIEFGAGTGRLTQMLAPFVAEIKAYDESPEMIDWARNMNSCSNVSFAVAPHQDVMMPPQLVDVSLAGWTFGHLIDWPDPIQWSTQIRNTLQRFLSVIKPGGIGIVIETLGTGKTSPEPPSVNLAKYYKVMEDDFGFESSWVRTDYKFNSVVEGRRLISKFFGEEMSAQFMASHLTTFPECTGVWCKQL